MGTQSSEAMTLLRKKPSLAEVTERFNIVTAALLGPPKRKPMKKVRKPSGQKQVFERIWNSRPHKCFVSGVTIHEPTASVFSHVLPKGMYPDYKLDERNIVLLTPRHHDLWHNAGKEALIRGDYGYDWGWKALFDLYDELKREAHAIL